MINADKTVKVGDTVKIVKYHTFNFPGEWGYYIGEEYEVKSVNYDGTPNVWPKDDPLEEIYLDAEEYEVIARA